MPFLTIASLNNPEVPVIWEPRPLEDLTILLMGELGLILVIFLIEISRKFAMSVSL